jgi:DNA-binding transcriptional LysR family regulator
MVHTSQSTISRLLGQLETSLRLRLFERVKGRLYPTPEGKALFAEVERSYIGLERIRERTRTR